MDEPYTDNPGVVNRFTSAPSEKTLLTDPTEGKVNPFWPSGMTATAVYALDAAMKADSPRLRALVASMTQCERDHLAKSADRLAMMAEDDTI